MKHTNTIPLVVEIFFHVVFPTVRKEILNVVFGLLSGTGGRTFEQVVRTIFAAGSGNIAFSAKVITALVTF